MIVHNYISFEPCFTWFVVLNKTYLNTNILGRNSSSVCSIAFICTTIFILYNIKNHPVANLLPSYVTFCQTLLINVYLLLLFLIIYVLKFFDFSIKISIFKSTYHIWYFIKCIFWMRCTRSQTFNVKAFPNYRCGTGKGY